MTADHISECLLTQMQANSNIFIVMKNMIMVFF